MIRRGLWVVDVQEGLFSKVQNAGDTIKAISFLLEVAPYFHLPVFVTEQYPTGLGPTVTDVLEKLKEPCHIWEKTTFSGYADKEVREAADLLADEWILVGLEAHICVLQTARDLQQAGKGVTICHDGVAARSAYQYSMAIAQLRDWGIRVTTSQTLVYEWLRDASHPVFKHLLPLIKKYD